MGYRSGIKPKGFHAKRVASTKTGARILKCLSEDSEGCGFAFGLRWLVSYSPLWGCAEQSASPKAIIPSRSSPRNFQTGCSAQLPQFSNLAMLQLREATGGGLNIWDVRIKEELYQRVLSRLSKAQAKIKSA